MFVCTNCLFVKSTHNAHSVDKTKRVLLLFYVARWVLFVVMIVKRYMLGSRSDIEINVTNDNNTRQESHRNNRNWYDIDRDREGAARVKYQHRYLYQRDVVNGI